MVDVTDQQPAQSEETPTRTPPDRRRIPLSNVQIILIALIVLGGRLALDFSERIVEGQQKVAEQRQLEAEVENLRAEQRALEASKAYYSSESFVEAWAHDDGKMVREGERLVIPVFEGQAPALEAVAPDTETLVPPWHIWWLLFFDSPAPLGTSGK
jgi:cell division protein FtsB